MGFILLLSCILKCNGDFELKPQGVKKKLQGKHCMNSSQSLYFKAAVLPVFTPVRFLECTVGAVDAFDLYQ